MFRPKKIPYLQTKKKLEQYLDDKTKEKSLVDGIKSKYGTKKGSRGMIIKKISESKTRFATKLMACKFMRKCCKEESPTSVIAATMQCAKWSLLS